MSTDYPIFYKEMATGMNEMSISINSFSDPLAKCSELLRYLINLTSEVDFNAAQAIVDIEPVMRNGVYNGLVVNVRDEAMLRKGVTAVNEHTKKYITSDLTDYVNNEVWSNSCVPYEWARMSEITGEDISNWNICEPS